MSSPAWMNWEVQVPSDDISTERTFCIVRDNTEFEADGSADQYIIGDTITPDDNLPASEWQMVRMSQVTKQSSTSSKPQEKVKCPECHKSFVNVNYLKDHMRIHTGEKPFACDECDAAFAQKCNLRMHQRIHSGERPFMCGICGRTFNRSSHLKGHMIQHTGEKPYVCETCGQRFTNSQGKKNHMKLHLGERPFQCEICNITFSHKPSLKAHIKTHRREAKYCCTICRRKFIFRSALFEHMSFHSKNKLYECDQCHKRYKQKHYLKKHKATICGSKSLLQSTEEECGEEIAVNDASRLKYRVLNTTKRAKPVYVDSEEECCYDTDDEKNFARRTKPISFTEGQEKRIKLMSDESDKYLDPSYLKLLKRLGMVTK